MIQRHARRLLKGAVRQVVPSCYVTWRGGPAGNRIALTFDDGPHPRYTEEIMSVLAEAGVPGTFFLVGKQVEKHPELAAELVRQGHELGNHTYSHVDLARVHWRRGIEELCATDRLLRSLDPGHAGIFRPPWGRIGLSGLAYAVRYGRRAVMWSLDSADHLLDGAQPILDRLAAAPLRGGDILLFHDDYSATAAILREVITHLRGRGFAFATVSQVLADRRFGTSLA